MLQQIRSATRYIWIFIAVAFVGGFLLMDTSGLIDSATITPTTAVAEVNGRKILYTEWQERVQQALSNQQRARPLTQDEIRQVEDDVLDEMIMQALLQQEYRRRHITVSVQELEQFARYDPPPFLYSAPDLQTDGRFDPVKYQRLLASPQARQGGLLVGLESYYRTEIPRQKLYEQLTEGLYVSPADLWRVWQDERDSAQVSYVAWRPAVDSAAIASVTDAEARAYFAKHRDTYKLPGFARLSAVHIPRIVSATDTAAARARIMRLRAEITSPNGKFEDVAKRESEDSASAADGGNLGRGGRGRFIADFEAAAYKLRPREVSQPVVTPYGFHLIKLDERKGDTLALRHILIRINQSDSAATATDRLADSLARIAQGAEDPALFDSAAKRLSLPIRTLEATEGRPAALGLQPVPSASAWAFGGSRTGEISELFDDESGYWMVRLDSLVEGGEPRFERAAMAVRAAVAREKALDRAMPEAQRFADAAAAGGLDVAAKASSLAIVKSPPFTRTQFVPGLGQYTKVMGTAFGLPVGAISAPIRAPDGVFVIRVDRRVNTDRAAFEKQLPTLTMQRLQVMRQQKLQLFHADLRTAAKIEDHRKTINAVARRLSETQ